MKEEGPASPLYESDVRRQVALWLDMARLPLREADERIMSATMYEDLRPVLDAITVARQAVNEAKDRLKADPELPPHLQRSPRFGLSHAEQIAEQKAQDEVRAALESPSETVTVNSSQGVEK